MTVVLSSFVTVVVAGFAVWKGYYESKKTDGRIEAVNLNIDDIKLRLKEAQAALVECSQKRETMQVELDAAKLNLNILMIQNKDQEHRIGDLTLSVTILTKVLQRESPEVSNLLSRVRKS